MTNALSVHFEPISIIRLRILGLTGLALFLLLNPGIGWEEGFSIIRLFLVIEGFHVWVVAFKKSFASFCLCLFVPFYAPYFVFANAEELFGHSLLTKLWAILAATATLAVITLLVAASQVVQMFGAEYVMGAM